MFNFFNKSSKDATQVQHETQEVSSAPTQLPDVRAKWKALAADRKITKEDAAALSIYRALYKADGIEGAISRLEKSFKPISNPVKLENGADPRYALKNALWSVRYSAFKDWMTEDEFKILLDMANAVRKEIK